MSHSSPQRGLGAEARRLAEDERRSINFDSTPTHSYLKALYKYPQAEFPYARLVEENQRRGRDEPEFELVDTGIFDERRYFDVFAEYVKAGPEDLLIRITVANRGPEPARIHVLPTFWFRNTWAWGRSGEGYWPRPSMSTVGEDGILAEQESLGRYRLHARAPEGGALAERLFTENETNLQRLYQVPNRHRHVKDAFDDYVVHGLRGAVNPERVGTKAAFHHVLEVPAGGTVLLPLRLFSETQAPRQLFGADFLLLHHHALHGARAGPGGSGLRGHRLEVLRALRRHRGRDEPPGRQRPVGGGRRLLLRPPLGGREGRPHAGALHGGAGPPLRRG